MKKGEMAPKKMLHPKYMFLHKRRLIRLWAFRLLSYLDWCKQGLSEHEIHIS